MLHFTERDGKILHAEFGEGVDPHGTSCRLRSLGGHRLQPQASQLGLVFHEVTEGCAAKATFLPFYFGSAVVRPVQVINFAHHQ